ncbi:hypothetical protein THZG08_440017 [Vibrio owensii]|nr:hypothetical protein THZG08_440017 [Vibrio owensii]CAH1579384.1 hypothetical protein THOA03_440017 [Vibrio owensii]
MQNIPLPDYSLKLTFVIKLQNHSYPNSALAFNFVVRRCI